MTYQETLRYLFTSTPVFQHSGASAYKPGLGTANALDDYLANPHRSYKTIHVGGTNGKGSVSHLLAAILQEAGYKTGLYTSPHLVDFRERIRVNGQMIPEAYVVGFTGKHKAFFEPLHPSFFELTSAMAFDYFRHEKVDYAIIEVGLGGRLDSTNIITPVLSVVTNVSFDHTNLLGSTLGEIAYEKAGIIKQGVPVVVGEPGAETINVFLKKAEQMDAPLFTPQDTPAADPATTGYGAISGELKGNAQQANAQTVLCALRALSGAGVRIPPEAVREGFAHVTGITGLRGRWQNVRQAPYTVLDVGHNEAAWAHLGLQIEEAAMRHPRLFMVVGLSNDKDIDAIVREMPRRGNYLFTQAASERALPARELALRAEAAGLKGAVCDSVDDAVRQAFAMASDDDMVFIGGSHFVVAEALLPEKNLLLLNNNL